MNILDHWKRNMSRQWVYVLRLSVELQRDRLCRWAKLFSYHHRWGKNLPLFHKLKIVKYISFPWSVHNARPEDNLVVIVLFAPCSYIILSNKFALTIVRKQVRLCLFINGSEWSWGACSCLRTYENKSLIFLEESQNIFCEFYICLNIVCFF